VANGGEIMLNFVVIKPFVCWEKLLKQCPKRRDVPLFVADIEDEMSDGFSLLYLEDVIEAPVGRENIQVRIQNQKRFADRFDYVFNSRKIIE